MRLLTSSVLALAVAAINAHSVSADDLGEIKKLVPAAAATSLREMDELASKTSLPKLSELESTTLTMVLMCLKLKDDEESLEEFRSLTGRAQPRPYQLAKEVNRSVRGRGRFRVATGPVTIIHADRITDFTCTVNGDSATGTMSFTVPEVIQGNVNYLARRIDEKWHIDEFIMPRHEVHIVRGDDGKWVQK